MAPGDDEAGETGQLALLPDLARARARRARERAEQADRAAEAAQPTVERPVARVLVDVPLAHLDRPFDYTVPAKLDADVRAGARVKVRFAGQDVDGFVLERVEHSDHEGRLAPLRRAVSAEPVLSPEVARLTEAVAARYAGTRSDVLRLAVPARHATTERRETPVPSPIEVDLEAARQVWAAFSGGEAFVDRLAEGDEPRAVWSVLSGRTWPMLLAQAAAATLASGRGTLLCLPDGKDVSRVDAALRAVLGDRDHHVVLTADVGPAARYRAFLKVARGAVRVVVGTRAAAFAPVHDLGLVGIWDDGDDLHAEPRAPYPHTREVLLLRAEQQGTAALLGGHARTVEAEYLLRTGWAHPLGPDRAGVRAGTPRVDITGATDRELARDPHTRAARLPRTAFEAIREGLARGPVLLQTPRQGYLSGLVCDSCRDPARCTRCHGPLQQTAAHRPPSCRWCGTEHRGWTCEVCGGHGLRAPVIGERRTAEELGRAFPSVPIRASGGDRVLAEVDDEPALVVATPGAEPVVAAGYACVVLLDTRLLLARTDLRTTEEALRRWWGAAALARPAAEGGRVVAVGDPSHPALQALLRWDPAGFAARELEERVSAHLPPASRLATLTGAEADLDSAVASLRLPPGAEVLGPVPAPVPPRAASAPARSATASGAGATARVAPPDLPPPLRVVLRVPRTAGPALARALVEMQGVRSARKLPPVRVQVDPPALD